MNHFIQIMKKDIKWFFQWKLLLLIFVPLIFYTLYIHFIYAKHDIKPWKVIIINEKELSPNSEKKDRTLSTFHTLEEESILLETSQEDNKIFYKPLGPLNNDEFIKRYTFSQGLKTNDSFEIIGSFSREEKLKREMTCEVIFFEILAIIFMGVTSIILKEKEIGVLYLHQVMPQSFYPYILSKFFIFMIVNNILTTAMIILNIGLHGLSILSKGWIDITLISGYSILGSHILGILCKDFKQFGIIYTFLILLGLSPVFLVANTKVQWELMRFNPVYIMYMSLKNNFFPLKNLSIDYYILGFFGFIFLLLMTNNILEKKVGG